VAGAILVATVPAVSAWGIFAYITHTLMTIGVTTPGVLSIGQVGVTFGVIYASRTFSIGIGLLLTSLFKSLYECINQWIEKKRVEPDINNSHESNELTTQLIVLRELSRNSQGAVVDPDRKIETAVGTETETETERVRVRVRARVRNDTNDTNNRKLDGDLLMQNYPSTPRLTNS
jgi:hypothetical protein